MICPVCGRDTLIRKGTEVICVACKAHGTCNMVDYPVLEKDIYCNIDFINEYNQCIGKYHQKGLCKINWNIVQKLKG